MDPVDAKNLPGLIGGQAMNPIVTWQLGVDGLGFTQVYAYNWRYAGGFLYVGLNGGGDGGGWAIFSLGDSKVAIGYGTVDQDNNFYQFYWNLANDMMLWLDPTINSDSIGPDQTFTLENLGHGYVALSIGGWYLSGQAGGWYPTNYGFGAGSIVLTNAPAPWAVGGDHLAILQITNSGYMLDLTNRPLGAIDLTNAYMEGCDLRGSDLSQVVSLQGADFTQAHLGSQDFGAAKLNNLDLGKAKTWFQAQFDTTDLTTIKTAAGALMEQATFFQTTLTKVNFKGAHLAGAVFHGATLDGTDFTGADLSSADFSKAKSLKDTIFSDAIMNGTIFNDTDLSSAVFDDSPKFTRGFAERTQFRRAIIPFGVLKSNWSYLDLTDATITQIPNSITNLNADQALLPDQVNMQNVDLSGGSGASFQGTRMYGAQLQGANLQGAKMKNALLKSARLDGANLTMADMTGAWLIVETATPRTPKKDLEAASLTGAFMFNTVLDQAHCDGVDFSGANFSTSLLSQQQASAVGAFMNDTLFNDAMAANAIFNGAQLSGANLANAHLVGASFQDNGSTATLLTRSMRGNVASIHSADVSGTNFTGAEMTGIDMGNIITSQTGGTFNQSFPGYNGANVPVIFNYGPTKMGNTNETQA
jgi:uncharacterized protein YjbI with pentapeptide repeats